MANNNNNNEVDNAIETLERIESNAEKWLNLDLDKKVKYLSDAISRLDNLLVEWGQLHAENVTKVDEQTTPHVYGNGYIVGPALLGNYLNVLKTTLGNYGNWDINEFPVSQADNDDKDHRVNNVWPTNAKDKLFAGGQYGVLYCDGTKELSRGKTYEDEKEAGLVVVLGAGNFSAPIELLNKMFVEHKVCVYKPNPVNKAVTGAMIKKLFSDLIEEGYLDVIEGGIEVGSAMINHDGCSQVMITGSNRTYDAIVWGSPQDLDQQNENKQNGVKQCEKQVDAELGNVNVCAVIPGNWTKKELSHQAKQIASVRMINGGHTCPSPQIILLPKDWDQGEEFVNNLKEELKNYLPEASYYPGTDKKYNKFKEEFEEVSEVLENENNQKLDNSLSPLFISDITYQDKNEIFETFESFCPVVGVHQVDCDATAEAFCPLAVDYINNTVWGNLSTTLLACSDTLKNNRDVVEHAVDNLEIGAVGINTWGGMCVSFSQLHWGAYPGNTPEDVQSGIGLGVGNYLMYDNLKKCALWSPTICPGHLLPPKGNGKQANLVGYRLASYTIYSTWWRLTKLVSGGIVGL